MLKALALEDWKSFGAGENARNRIHFAPLTLFVGPNASGKSNVLDALRFLQGGALDYPLADVLRGRWEGGRETWPAIRGGVAEASRVGATVFGLRSEWEVEGGRITHHVQVSVESDVSVWSEKLEGSSGYLFDTGESGRLTGGGVRAKHRQTGPGKPPQSDYPATRLLLGQVRAGGRVAQDVEYWAQQVRAQLRGAVFLDIRPSLMRDYRPENGGHLGVSGENISPVLYALKDQKRFEGIVGWLQELCAGEIETIAFDRTTQLREVMMLLVEGGGRKTSARSASDGTLRFLGQVVALQTSDPGTLVILEEPDVGLHPARIRLLAELLQQVADRGVQVIATTHSPTLLAHLSPTTLGNVVAFGRQEGISVCSRLADLPHFEKLRDSKDVEHLISTGWVERAL